MDYFELQIKNFGLLVPALKLINFRVSRQGKEAWLGKGEVNT